MNLSSITRIFITNYLPGLLISVAIAITVAIMSKKRNYKPSRDKRATWREIGIRRSIPAGRCFFLSSF
ncbi:hypothetical protein [Agrobacterium sp. DSM 25558]|uniref:hypothetical protein n=1 Tax=Agrobacterium sp. DSM 25558 TaxID=1907665 RepID=UPI00097D2F6A|nr:hypothetical protein [Agrobacterium sp. DSM 25558]